VTVTYNYTKSPVDVGKLNVEILESSIVTALESSSFNEPDSLSIDFVSALSGGEQTILNAVVGAHGGVPIPWPADLPTFGAVPSGALIISNGVDSTYWGYDSLINLSDGPGGYYKGWYLKSTASGTEWATIPDTFLALFDTPTTYSGYARKALRVNADETGVEFVGQTSTEYPRYYIEPDLYVTVNDFGQYNIEETVKIEVAGTLDLGNGSMLIIKEGVN